jgi:hypothetical protein
MPRKYRKVCMECGSEDLLFDAYMYWDVDYQEYRLNGIYDNTYCNSCGGECNYVDVLIKEVPTNIKTI